MQNIPLEILCIDKTKLHSISPNAQAHPPDYQFPPCQRDWISSGGEKIVCICNKIIGKSLTFYETQNTEIICVKITIKKRKWEFFVYRPPNKNNVKIILRN